MNEITDKEISERMKLFVKPITFKVKNMFGEDVWIKQDRVFTYASRRDELFHKLLTGWNIERVKAGFKPLSKARLASALAKNPHLRPYDDEGNETNNDEDLFTLINECEKKGNYKKAHFILFPKKK